MEKVSALTLIHLRKNQYHVGGKQMKLSDKAVGVLKKGKRVDVLVAYATDSESKIMQEVWIKIKPKSAQEWIDEC